MWYQSQDCKIDSVNKLLAIFLKKKNWINNWIRNLFFTSKIVYYRELLVSYKQFLVRILFTEN